MFYVVTVTAVPAVQIAHGCVSMAALAVFVIVFAAHVYICTAEGTHYCVSMAAVVTRTHYSGTLYVHFLSRYLAQLDNVTPVMMDRNDPTLTSDYGALGLTP